MQADPITLSATLLKYSRYQSLNCFQWLHNAFRYMISNGQKQVLLQFATVRQIEGKDVGKIFKIRIGHNGSGMGSGWFLETVDVKHLVMALVPKEKKKEEKKKKKKKKMDEGNEDEDGGEEVQEVVLTYHFPCCRWLAGDEEDGELLVELLPEDSDELEGTEFNKCDADERERC